MSVANGARRTLIRFGKVCPFVLCFIVLISDVENIFAIATNNTIWYGNTLVYNTPISFKIGSVSEYDIFAVGIIGLISISIEACVYNITAVIFLAFLLYRNYHFAISEPYENSIYLTTMTICSIIEIFYIYKGLRILFTKQ